MILFNELCARRLDLSPNVFKQLHHSVVFIVIWITSFTTQVCRHTYMSEHFLLLKTCLVFFILEFLADHTAALSIFHKGFYDCKSIILSAYYVLNHWNVISCPDRPPTATAWLPFGWHAVFNFSNQTINTCHTPSLVRKLLLDVGLPLFSVLRPFVK